MAPDVAEKLDSFIASFCLYKLVLYVLMFGEVVLRV